MTSTRELMRGIAEHDIQQTVMCLEDKSSRVP